MFDDNRFEVDPVADAPRSVSGLKNDPARCGEFMDWGVGLFIHWSLDAALGCVISHTMVGASEDYLDRFVHELPKFFDPRDYDPEAWAKLAKLAGFHYMVLTTKHHSGFCLWPTATTEFSIAQTPYKRDIVGQFPFEQERIFRELALWMFVNGECIHRIRPCPVIREGNLWFTRRGEDEGTVYVTIPQGETLWKRGERREFTLRSLRGDGATKISVLGQNSRVVEYQPEANPECRLAQTDEGLWISVVRAQRLYNDHKWPNPVVVKLEGASFLADDH